MSKYDRIALFFIHMLWMDTRSWTLQINVVGTLFASFKLATFCDFWIDICFPWMCNKNLINIWSQKWEKDLNTLYQFELTLLVVCQAISQSLDLPCVPYNPGRQIHLYMVVLVQKQSNTVYMFYWNRHLLKVSSEW